MQEEKKPNMQQRSFLLFIRVSLILPMLVGCGGSPVEDLIAVDYTPLSGHDWNV